MDGMTWLDRISFLGLIALYFAVVIASPKRNDRARVLVETHARIERPECCRFVLGLRCVKAIA